MEALCREMEMRSGNAMFRNLSTVYLGGGTPSQLTIKQLGEIFARIGELFVVDEDAEITMECNPDDVTPAFADALRDLPVNRVSLGVQTFNTERLVFLKRRHMASQVLHAIERLRQARIENISIDLMFGFPGQTFDEWREDIDKTISLQVEHISAYSLMYEENTPIYNIREKQIADGLVDQDKEDELSAKMYEMLMERLEQAGYEHYEISNFAMKHTNGSYRSRHNSSYWQGVPYLGIGAAAHSYDIDSRQWNVADIHQYIQAIHQGEVPAEREILTDDMRYNDMITTALRTKEGIALNHLQKEYQDFLLRQSQKYIAQGLMNLCDNSISLSKIGLFVCDSIMSDLIFV
jgi:oxygen-independent coproporphyrinogen-3 oxidase